MTSQQRGVISVFRQHYRGVRRRTTGLPEIGARH
jgi:hypothetical protein